MNNAEAHLKAQGVKLWADDDSDDEDAPTPRRGDQFFCREMMNSSSKFDLFNFQSRMLSAVQPRNQF